MINIVIEYGKSIYLDINDGYPRYILDIWHIVFLKSKYGKYDIYIQNTI